jgi:hypothetical protein
MKIIALLAAGAGMGYANLVEIVFAAAAEVSSVPFKDGKSDVINCKDDTDTKYRFAKYDK